MTLDEPRDVQVRGVCLPPHPVHVEQGALPGGPPPLHAGNTTRGNISLEKLKLYRATKYKITSKEEKKKIIDIN